MSYKKHNFGDNVCNYYDMEDLVNYVKPCETGYYCQDTESSAHGADSQHKLHTCQKYMKIPANPSTPLKGKDEECNNNAECGFGLTCITIGSETKTKCNIDCPTDQKLYVINGNYECRYEAYKDMCQFTKDSTIQNYPNRNKCKTCGLIHFDEKKDGSQKIYYVMNSVDETDKYSQPDNTFVLNEDACQSGTALYFYGDGSIKNNIDTAHAIENKLYLKCVTIKAVDHGSKKFNYTIGDDTIHIYDIEKVEYDNVDTNNDRISDKKAELTNLCTKYLMTEIGLWNDNKDEFINYLKCTDENQADDNLKRKLYYWVNPEEYLLYKDQTEVMEYLIQKKYPEIVPIIKAKEEEGAGFLNSKYLILSLLLLFL
jgi:hypothetical protein